MSTIRQSTHALLRHLDMRIIFGNPGSTELPFLADLPADFAYILALNEATATAMADGYAQATGRPALVSLHTAPGLGNAMGSLVNAAGAGSPVVALVGQQVRAALPTPALLVNRDPLRLAQGAVKHSAEPARPEDTPEILCQAVRRAAQSPAGPVCVSVPMDDWDRPAHAGVDGARRPPHTDDAVLAPAALRELTALLGGAGSPALIAGPELDCEDGYAAVVALAELLGSPVWLPAFSPRAGFPSAHPAARGPLPSSADEIAETLAGHDVVLALGAPVFTYYQWSGGPAVAPGTRVVQVTSDPEQAARSVTGGSYIGSPAEAARSLSGSLVADGFRPVGRTAVTGARRPRPEVPLTEEGTMGDVEIFRTISEVLPDDAVLVNEAAQQLPAYWESASSARPGSFYFTGAGGLGFGLAGAVGIQLAQPRRPVVAVVGDGSVQYTLQALWTAARYRIPLTVVVLDNSEYGILKQWGRSLGIGDVPGLDLPGIDVTGLAHAYGVSARSTRSAQELKNALIEALGSPEPQLIHVPLAT